MKFVPVLVAFCVLSQAAYAEGLECRRVADPVPRLSCVETSATAEAPTTQRPHEWTPSEAPRRDVGTSRDSDATRAPNTRYPKY